ncbi:MAG: family 78 glycoside hydrolase catalytic domain [Phycisphaeraceae bacterium]|nr:MAG: family 78 glycoside hydrolase catalytic domain [Phycisphaeraceae bacterium]
MHARLPLFAPLLALFVMTTPALARTPLNCTGLRCEYLNDPIAIDSPAPRLSWIVTSESRGARQTAYRILVASSPDMLANGVGDLWDTGKVESNDTVLIPYRGAPLASREACSWKVMSWNRDGEPGEWSAPARWEMGLLSAEDWHAQWINAGPTLSAVTIDRAEYATVDGKVAVDVARFVNEMTGRGLPVTVTNQALGGDPAYGVRKHLLIDYHADGVAHQADLAEGESASLADARWPYLRKTFSLDKPVRAARLYTTSLGFADTWLNGQRIGSAYLTPGWTDYRKRVRYHVYDVTDQLIDGSNVLGALIAPGWYAGRAGLFHAKAFYGDIPAYLAQLEITYEDGSTEHILSDESWQRHDGPILAADIMDGETYDATKAIDGWCTPLASAGDWGPVTTRTESRNLEAPPDLPVRVLEELPVQAIAQPTPGRWVFDLKQNMVGVARIRVNEKPGTVLTIHYAEMLNRDGTIYTANLRGAAATDTYICRGPGPNGEPETWTPTFTFHGFRYVEITGLTGKPTTDTVTGIVLGSDLPPTGSFACSDPRLNQLYSNIVWGLHGNYLSIPTDCPQRDERMGWMGDAQAFIPTASYITNVAPFMTKWMRDVRDAQRDDGAEPDVAPTMKGLNFGTPAWGDAGVIVPWTIYEMYGDTRILESNIDSMTRWVDWCTEHSTGLIRDHDRGNDYGDWLSINADTPKELIGTAYFAHSTDLVARSYQALGLTNKARHYRDLFNKIRAAYAAKYIDADGRIEGDTQTAYVISLAFNLVPDDLRRAATDRLVADVRGRGWRLSTGFIGVGHLLPTLDDAGHPDAACRLLMQDAFPSWLFSVKHGATTIWERWNGWTPEDGMNDPGMNSFNHYALGSCGQWLFAGVGGIRPDEPGFSRFIIEPRIGGGLTIADVSFRSVHGLIASSWSLRGDRLELFVEIPANTTATIDIPARPGADVLESGHPLDNAEGLKLVRRDENAVVVEAGSGRYSFTTTRPEARAGNPIVPGWYADPEVTVFDDTVWIYPTTSAPYDEQTSFDAFSSTDLATWTRHPRVLEAKYVPWATRAMWAPSVVHKGDRYYFFFGANDIQNDDELGGIGVAISDSPAGPFVDTLRHPLVDAFHNGAQPIDQFVFQDPSGRDYLIYGGWRHCNIARLNDDYTGFVPFDDGTTFKEITPEGYVEGPFMFVRDGKYYFMWSEGGWTGPDYAVAYAIADSPLGPFQRVGQILHQDPAVATGAGHHSVLKIPGTDDHAIVYHRRPLLETDRNHRVVCIDKMTFDAEGRINPVKITFEGIDPLE